MALASSAKPGPECSAYTAAPTVRPPCPGSPIWQTVHGFWRRECWQKSLSNPSAAPPAGRSVVGRASCRNALDESRALPGAVAPCPKFAVKFAFVFCAGAILAFQSGACRHWVWPASQAVNKGGAEPSTNLVMHERFCFCEQRGSCGE